MSLFLDVYQGIFCTFSFMDIPLLPLEMMTAIFMHEFSKFLYCIKILIGIRTSFAVIEETSMRIVHRCVSSKMRKFSNF